MFSKDKKKPTHSHASHLVALCLARFALRTDNVLIFPIIVQCIAFVPTRPSLSPFFEIRLASAIILLPGQSLGE